ncbi:MAG: alpha-L-fucosidase [Clostridia bacterium]|nr:alpha-L-fucosidase [Clostridia bacterium]
MKKAYELACEAKPTARQIEWQQTEFYALISYGMPVFTGKQYGDGFTPPTVFWPEEMNTDLWCETAVKAGMNGIVFTCKHYDGFCLWPTAFTDYSIKNSNWLDGDGDLVKMVAESCKKYGLKFGVYIAPWDRHEKSYGSGKEYDDYFCNLLTELLSNYGDIFCVWLDGVCGADERKVQKYDWGRYYKLIRELQPNAVISFRGPDVRWCGNEKGVTRQQEWSSVPAYLGVNEDGERAGTPPKKQSQLMSLDIGSRKAIKKDTEFIWYPCEVSVPLHDSWFFDENEKYSAKTKDKLLKLYYRTVGNNSCLMLGLAPNKRGEFDDVDNQILSAFGYDLKVMFGYNLLTECVDITASSELSPLYSAENCKTKELSKCWRPAENDKKPEIIVTLNEDDIFDKIVLSENIINGQHVEEFEIFYLTEKGKWKKLYEGNLIGYKHICCVEATKTQKLKFVFNEYRTYLEISHISIN